MTQGDARKRALLEAGDVSAETEALSQTEIEQMHIHPGRGAQPVEGADASEDYLDEHAEGENDPAPDLAQPRHKR
ncbi:hypothetical protein [Deinococcus sp.]|uniref:hypothetical protein n=1 Tax=Deinococcus sp. TaxID=47478 RepID=UPI003CC57614